VIKVLVLDDDRDHYELTKAQLAQISDDIVFESVNSSQTARDALKDDVYDCILTDDQFLKNEAIELLKTLRREENFIPFVVLSELYDQEKKNFLERAYSDDELNVAVNFFHFDLLNHWIHRLVDRYRQFTPGDKLEIDLFPSSPEKN